jgi:transposase, IS6 family
MLAVRWYLRYGLSYRDVEELLAERGIAVDHVTIYRWVQRFTPELIDAARPRRHVGGDRWFVDETYLKVAGQWVYLYRAIDQHGQVIDVLASPKRDLAATRRFFARALNAARRPTEVTTDRAPAYPRVLDELVPEAWHVVEQYAKNPIGADHGRLKARTRPMRGLKRIRSAQVVCSGHAFVQNLRRGHYHSASMPSPAAGSRRASPNWPLPPEQRLYRGESACSSPTQQRRFWHPQARPLGPNTRVERSFGGPSMAGADFRASSPHVVASRS